MNVLNDFLANPPWNELLVGFISGCVSNLLAGVLLAGFVYWAIERRSDLFHRKEQRKNEELNEINKSLKYLETLKSDIVQLQEILPFWREQWASNQWGIELNLATPYWDIVEKGGDLPRLLEPNLVKQLAQFYDYLAYARRGRDLMVNMWMIPKVEAADIPGFSSKENAFFSLTLTSIESALDFAPRLLQLIERNITDLRNKMAELSNSK